MVNSRNVYTLGSFACGVAGALVLNRFLVEKLMGDVAFKGMLRYLTDAQGFIARNDIVLDVGSGDRPHLRANIICDKYEDGETAERGGNMIKDRPLVIGDIYDLPFKNKSVDAVICQHLLEHVVDIEGALSELDRVGKRGIIRTPSAIAEKLFSRDFHRWMVTKQNHSKSETIVFEQKAERYIDKDLNQALGANPGFWHFFGRNISMMETEYKWIDKINYRVARLDVEPWSDESYDPTVTDTKRMQLRDLVTRVIGQLYRRIVLYPEPEIDWQNILACPICKGDLKLGSGALCSACNVHYPVENGVFVLLKDRAIVTRSSQYQPA